LICFASHADLPVASNVFIDSEGNVRLGDFGLATHRRESQYANKVEFSETESSLVYSAVENIGHLIGPVAADASNEASFSEGMTEGVGTTLYRAPEQESGGHHWLQGTKSYSFQADIFSLGVIIFEIFHPPFATYMERAAILSSVRQDRHLSHTNGRDASDSSESERFPSSFINSTQESVQRLILWCLERDPKQRPNADQLLSSDLLPRKMEVEQRYLEEALSLLVGTQSESYLQILDALFSRPTSELTELTFDTDVSAQANNIGYNGGKRTISLVEQLVKSIENIRAGAVDITSLRSLTLSASCVVAATSSFLRARNCGKIAKDGMGMLKKPTQRTAGILAMRAATSTAVTGMFDGIHGADPSVVEFFCCRLKYIFECHGAVRLQCPLLRPRNTGKTMNAVGGPAELINSRGIGMCNINVRCGT
jgi:serine/threonine protein kinase